MYSALQVQSTELFGEFTALARQPPHCAPRPTQTLPTPCCAQAWPALQSSLLHSLCIHTCRGCCAHFSRACFVQPHCSSGLLQRAPSLPFASCSAAFSSSHPGGPATSSFLAPSGSFPARAAVPSLPASEPQPWPLPGSPDLSSWAGPAQCTATTPGFSRILFTSH